MKPMGGSEIYNVSAVMQSDVRKMKIAFPSVAHLFGSVRLELRWSLSLIRSHHTIDTHTIILTHTHTHTHTHNTHTHTHTHAHTHILVQLSPSPLPGSLSFFSTNSSSFFSYECVGMSVDSACYGLISSK